MLKRAYQPANVLVVEDTPSDAEITRACLEEGTGGAFNVVHASSMAAALPILAERNMAAVMLDLFLPDAEELDGLAGIHSVSPDMPVLIVTGRDDEEMANEAVAQGAQDYLLKDRINAPMLQRTLRHAIQRKYHEKAIVHQAYFDRLSGLPNRELFMERLNVALARQQRAQQSIGLMMLDLNGFKAINDTYGHDAGDLVLREVGRRMPMCLRPYDLAARLGGDEFTVLIEDGILKGYIQDTLNARLMKMPVTGNARRESYAALPMPRMTNTYMLNGERDPQEIIESVKHGLYAVNFGGGQVDITNGKFVFSASEAYMIEDGKLTYPVKGATLIGSGPESLKDISMIGNDMALDSGIGVCGKDGQSVPVGVGQPTLRIDRMTVGGTA